jgi:hypothetical protein
MRPLRIDTFPFHDELDMLECRLTEIFDAVDFVIAVEADVTHQDNPKPYYLTENLQRFDAFRDKLIVVRATGLPTIADDPDPWARELAQREHVATGLAQIGNVTNHDIILHGDVDALGHRHRGSACTRTVQHNAVRVHVLQRKVLVCGCPEGCHVTQQRQSAPTRRKLNAGQMRHVQADRISCFNRHRAEFAGYWESTSFFEEEGREEKR